MYTVSQTCDYLWSPYRIGQTIIFSVVCSIFFLSSFFPCLISAGADWMSAIPAHNCHTWCGVSANLRCRSETRCTWLAENTGHKKSLKSPSGHHRTNFSAMSSQLRHVSTIGKKNLISGNIFSTGRHNMATFGPLAAEIDPVVWGHPCKFQRVSGLVCLVVTLTHINRFG